MSHSKISSIKDKSKLLNTVPVCASELEKVSIIYNQPNKIDPNTKTHDLKLSNKNCSLKTYIEYEWLTTVQAASYLKVSVESLRNMTSNGKIIFYKLGKRNRYRIDDLRRLLLSTKKGANHEY